MWTSELSLLNPKLGELKSALIYPIKHLEFHIFLYHSISLNYSDREYLRYMSVAISCIIWDGESNKSTT